MVIKKNKGFTLIELLIVIAILGVLAAGVVAAINPAKRLGQARDARRKTDIATIRNALESYAVSHGSMYPPAGACVYGTNCYVYSTSGSNWIPDLVTNGDLKTVPVDPQNGSCAPWSIACATSYRYSYGNVTLDGQNFDLVAHLENTDDPDRCEVKDYLWLGNHWCVAFGGNYSNQIYAKGSRGSTY